MRFAPDVARVYPAANPAPAFDARADACARVFVAAAAFNCAAPAFLCNLSNCAADAAASDIDRPSAAPARRPSAGTPDRAR